MANVANLTIGITANTQGLVSGLNTASVTVKQFSGGINAAGVALGSIMARGVDVARDAVSRLVDVMRTGVQEAGDLQETINRFNAVFGDQAASVDSWADSLSSAVGRFKGDVLEASSSFQSFFVGLGFGKSQAASMSKQLTQLGIDFASFNNLSDEEAVQRFISALSGSSEVLDKFGVNIRQAALQQELLAMGVNKSWSAVTEQEKAMARLSIIMRTMGEQGAVGDAVATAGSFANQMKALDAAVRQAQVSIGEALIPIITDVLPEVAALARDAAAAFVAFVTNGKQGATTLRDNLVGGLQFLRRSLPAAVSLLNVFISRWEFVGGAASVALGAITVGLGQIEKAIAFINGKPLTLNLEQIGRDLIKAGSSGISDSFTRFGDAISGVTADGITKGIDAAISAASKGGPFKPEDYKLPDLQTSSVGDSTDAFREAAEEWQRIGERLASSVETPAEKLQASVAEATEAFQRGAIDGVQYSRVLSKIREDFMRASESAQMLTGGIAAVRQGTGEAMSRIAEARRAREAFDLQQGRRGEADALIRDARDKAQEEIAKRLEEQKRIANAQLDEQRRQADELRQMNDKLDRLPGLRVVGA